MTRTAWWRGARGEWYVVAQLALMAAVFFGPRNAPGWAPLAVPPFVTIVGVVMMAAGACGLLVSLFALGRNLTPLPHPKDEAMRVETGPYRYVRHPMYVAGLLLAFGWALFARGWLTLAWAVALFVLLDVKSRREERWLVEKFPDYRDYRRRVRRFIPFLY